MNVFQYEVCVQFLNRLNEYLLIMGIPGLLVISFLDSAGVPLPGGPDTVIILLAWRRPEMAFLIVPAAAIGSMLGCLVLYGIGLKGGEKALSRFNPEKAARVKQKMHENAAWAVLVAVIAPPPFPTKILILAAGALRMGKIRFSATVLAGRILRYSLIGFLAARYGDQAAQILKSHSAAFFLVLGVTLVLILLIRNFGNRRKHSEIQAVPPPES
jgi:membrane protein YqaA with SNARE-associated domain